MTFVLLYCGITGKLIDMRDEISALSFYQDTKGVVTTEFRIRDVGDYDSLLE